MPACRVREETPQHEGDARRRPRRTARPGLNRGRIAPAERRGKRMKQNRRGRLTEAPAASGGALVPGHAVEPAPGHPAPPTPERIAEIADHFRRIIEILGLDLSDPNLVETPERVAKMYFELFQ